MKKIAIIGGGISGLSAAYTFQKEEGVGKNFDYVLLEASNHLGGVVITEKVNGFLIEGGPDCYISTKPEVIKLANELGMGDRLLNSSEENKGPYIFSSGKLHELPEGIMTMVPTKLKPFLKTKLISWPGKLRAALDLIIPPKRNNDEESLGQFVRRRLGKEILDKIAEPLVGGIHASDPETMSLKSTFPRFIEMEKEYGSLIKGSLAVMRKAKEARKKAAVSSPKGPGRTFFMSFAGGMQELADTLVANLDKDKVLTGKKVDKIRFDKKNNGYKIDLAGGESLLADAVIVAAPAFAAAQMLEEVDGVLSQGLGEISYADSATISLGFKRENLRNIPKGFGVIVPLAEGRRLMAATWSSNKWASRAKEGFFLARGFVGGSRNQKYVNLEDKDLIKLTQEELKIIAGIDAEPEVTKIYRWRKGMAQYTIGHAQRVAKIEDRASKLSGLFLAGNAYHGVGLSDCIKGGQEVAGTALGFLRK